MRGRRGVLRHMHEHALLGEALGAQRDDEFLAEQIADQRAHRARHDAHRDHRHGDGGQHHELDVRPVPGPAAGAGADRGQPAELHREDDHQHHAEPVVRHRHAGDRERGDELVDPGVAEVAGEEAEHQAEHEADQRGEHRQHDGVADRAADFLGDRAAGGDRGAEVAVAAPSRPRCRTGPAAAGRSRRPCASGRRAPAMASGGSTETSGSPGAMCTSRKHTSATANTTGTTRTRRLAM